MSALTARVAILTTEITSARCEVANQTELANKTLQKNEALRKQAAAVTSQNAKLKTRNLTQVSVIIRGIKYAMERARGAFVKQSKCQQ